MERRTLLISAAAVVAGLGLLGGLWAIGAAVDGGSGGASGTDPRTLPTPAASAVPAAEAMPPMDLSANVDYVALGDSFAAGMGAGDETGGCVRSEFSSYPAVFASDSGVTLMRNAACSGATTDTLLDKQLRALKDDTDLVTVSIGGNDLGVAGLATSCSGGGGAACQSDFQKALTVLKTLPARLEQTYLAISAAAPNARIVVTGYPMLYQLPATDDPKFVTTAAVNTATALLDGDLRQAVEAVQKRGVSIWYVDVSFAGHGLGSAKPWVNDSGPVAFHPNAAGYRAYAEALSTALRGKYAEAAK